MADVQVNLVPKRWLNGGVVKLVGATDSYIINNIHDGAFDFAPLRRETIQYKDRGVYQAPIEGDDTLGEGTIEVMCGALQGSTSLIPQLIQDGPTTSNLAFEFTSMVLDFPVSRGGSTGERVTLGNVSIKPDIKWSKGETMDKLTFGFNYRTYASASY